MPDQLTEPIPDHRSHHRKRIASLLSLLTYLLVAYGLAAVAVPQLKPPGGFLGTFIVGSILALLVIFDLTYGYRLIQQEIRRPLGMWIWTSAFLLAVLFGILGVRSLYAAINWFGWDRLVAALVVGITAAVMFVVLRLREIPFVGGKPLGIVTLFCSAALVFLLFGNFGFYLPRFLKGKTVMVAIPTPGMAEYLRGRPAPLFTLQTIDEEEVSLEDQRGNVVVLNWWATWCDPCEAEMPQLEAIYREEKDNGLVLLAVSVDAEKDTVTAFLAEYEYSFTILYAGVGGLDDYPLPGIPTTYVIDKEGTVRYVRVGYWPGDEEMLQEEVARLLKE